MRNIFTASAPLYNRTKQRAWRDRISDNSLGMGAAGRISDRYASNLSDLSEMRCAVLCSLYGTKVREPVYAMQEVEKMNGKATFPFYVWQECPL